MIKKIWRARVLVVLLVLIAAILLFVASKLIGGGSNETANQDGGRAIPVAAVGAVIIIGSFARWRNQAKEREGERADNSRKTGQLKNGGEKNKDRQEQAVVETKKPGEASAWPAAIVFLGMLATTAIVVWMIWGRTAFSRPLTPTTGSVHVTPLTSPTDHDISVQRLGGEVGWDCVDDITSQSWSTKAIRIPDFCHVIIHASENILVRLPTGEERKAGPAYEFDHWKDIRSGEFRFKKMTPGVARVKIIWEPDRIPD